MRKQALVLVSCVFLAALSLSAQQRLPDPADVQIKTVKLTPNTYMLQFVGPKPGLAGGDVGLYVGEDGLVLVDTGYAPLAAKLDQAIKAISDKPVKFIINTHWHGDHAGGDSYFKTATIVIQENGAKRMEAGSAGSAAFGNAAVHPGITFGDQLTIHFYGDDIRAVHFEHGHTGGDSIVFFPESKVVQMGDVFVYPENPAFIPIDMDHDGSGGVQGAIAAAEYALANTPDDVKIIPGHGDIATKADLAKALKVLKDTSAVVQKGIDQGKTLDQLKQEGALAPWDYLNNSGHIKADAYFDRLYQSLSAKSKGTAK